MYIVQKMISNILLLMPPLLKSEASLFFLSKLEGRSETLNESWRLKGEVRWFSRLNSRNEVCLCNIKSVAWGRAMAKGLAVSGSSDLGRIGGGSNAGLIPCNEKKNKWNKKWHHMFTICYRYILFIKRAQLFNSFSANFLQDINSISYFSR